MFISTGLLETLQVTAALSTNNSGTLDATLNWWGSNTSPTGKVYGNVKITPWLVLNAAANPTSIINGGKSTVTADLLHDSNDVYHNPALGHVPDGIPVKFTSDSKGSVNPSANGTINGQATTTFTAIILGISTITSTVDSQPVTTNVSISNVKLVVTASDQ